MGYAMGSGRGNGHGHGKVDSGYVSEFTDFINHYLEEHPEVVEDQRIGRAIYWDRKVDLKALEKAAKDTVPDDRYGFDYSAWHGAEGIMPSRGR